MARQPDTSRPPRPRAGLRRPAGLQRTRATTGPRGTRPSPRGIRPRLRAALRRASAATLLGLVMVCATLPATAFGAAGPGTGVGAPPLAQAAAPAGGSLETAASRAGDTGRKIGLSLIGLALSVAAVVLVFKRDFKEAVGVVAIGIVAVLLVSPAGLNVLQDTVSLLFGT
jgi:hypothetical protein